VTNSSDKVLFPNHKQTTYVCIQAKSQAEVLICIAGKGALMETSTEAMEFQMVDTCLYHMCAVVEVM